MRRWYVYLSDASAPADGAPTLPLVGYVENNCYSNSTSFAPGALEVAHAVFGRNCEVVDGGSALFPRRCPVDFVRLGNSKRIFVARGLQN